MKSVIFALLLLATTQSFASGAVMYNCLGKDVLSNENIVFTLLFGSHSNQTGYTDQSITITQKGWEQYENPIVLQMYKATKKNNCTKNQDGEIHLKTDFKMDPASEADIADFIVTFKSDCPELKLDVKSYCIR